MEKPKISAQANQPIRFGWLGFGETVAVSTMGKMKDIINSSIRDYYVRLWAERVVEGYNDWSKVDSIYNFLASHTKYVKDPYGLELLRTPQVILKQIEQGEIPGLDCDDLVLVSLSMLKSIGFRVAFRITSYSQEKDFGHIYGLVFVRPQGWVPFDLVGATRGQPFGYEAPGATRIYDEEI